MWSLHFLTFQNDTPNENICVIYTEFGNLISINIETTNATNPAITEPV